MKDGKNYPGVFRPKDIQHVEYPKDILEDSQTETSRKKSGQTQAEAGYFIA